MECLFIGLGAYFIQHMGSFNYGKIRTMGAVLVAISIPIFTSQLEKSREATDAANIRAAYATVQSAALMQESQAELTKISTSDITYSTAGTEGSLVYKATVTMKQKNDKWQSGAQDIGGVSISADATGTTTKAWVVYTQSTGKTTITFGETEPTA